MKKFILLAILATFVFIGSTQAFEETPNFENIFWEDIVCGKRVILPAVPELVFDNFPYNSPNPTACLMLGIGLVLLTAYRRQHDHQ